MIMPTTSMTTATCMARTVTTAIKSRCVTPLKMLAATTHALAAARRNSRSATAPKLLMSSPVLLMAIAGGLLVAALAAYASYLWRQVWAQQRARSAARADQQQRLSADLRILANSLINTQLPLIEGAIRIKVLLDNLDQGLSQDPHCQVFHQLHDACADVPSHQHWRALSKAQRAEYRQRFAHLHSQYEQQALSAARWLLEQGLPTTAQQP